MSASTPTALVGTADEGLREQAFRWCAALGVEVQAVEASEGVRRGWRDPDVVLVGDDLLTGLLEHPPTRRDHVVVVSDRPDEVWRLAVQLGATGVHGAGDEQAAIEAIGAALDGGSEGCAVSVVGGSGGVGATTFATGLALAGARRGLGAVLIDADPDGAGVELVLGSERVEGLRWPDLVEAGGRLSGAALAGALPHRHGVASVAWPAREPAAAVPVGARSVWVAATRAFDLVVTDVPRRSVEPAVVVPSAASLVVVVVEDRLGGLGAARRLLARPEGWGGHVVAVSAGRSSSRRSVEDVLGIPVVASYSRSRRTRTDVEQGRGPGRSRSLRRACADVLDLVGL